MLKTSFFFKFEKQSRLVIAGIPKKMLYKVVNFEYPVVFRGKRRQLCVRYLTSTRGLQPGEKSFIRELRASFNKSSDT